jgi:hypothetical protein
MLPAAERQITSLLVVRFFACGAEKRTTKGGKRL